MSTKLRWIFFYGHFCSFLVHLLELVQTANNSRYFTHLGNIARLFSLPPAACQKLPPQPRALHCVLALSLLLVFWIARGGIGRLRGKQAPGWIISCSLMPDGHIAVTWRGNGKWHHYHSNTGTTFGVRAGFQRICHTTSHLPTGKTIMLTSLATHSMDNYFIWNVIILVTFVVISCGV